jgi:hypothetical protein
MQESNVGFNYRCGSHGSIYLYSASRQCELGVVIYFNFYGRVSVLVLVLVLNTGEHDIGRTATRQTRQDDSNSDGWIRFTCSGVATVTNLLRLINEFTAFLLR